MRIYLVRHGETVLNCRKCYYGFTDAPLNENGIKQAESLRSFFSTMDFDYIISSPLKRAADTARIVTGAEAEEITLDERLMEQNFGIFERHTCEELLSKYPEEFDAWNRDFSDYRIDGGESFRDVRNRVEDFAASLPTGRGSILLAAHKGTLGHLMAALLKMPLEGYWNFVFEQGCYSCVDVEDGYAIVRKLNQSIPAGEEK